jgi:hypothetical protein
VYLSPNTLKEVAVDAQGAAVFKIPWYDTRRLSLYLCACSWCTSPNTGFPYPISWYLLPQNVVCYIFLGIWINISPAIQATVKARNDAGYPGGLPLFSPRQAPTLCMAVPELEYPLIVPPSVIPCGPILLPSRPLAEADPELAAWVSRRPTVLILLGTLFDQDPAHAAATLGAIKILFANRDDVQVLWKWRNLGSWALPSAEALGDRLRIVNWLQADPTSVLRYGVACSVNHGGSNSYHEALAYVHTVGLRAGRN